MRFGFYLHSIKRCAIFADIICEKIYCMKSKSFHAYYNTTHIFIWAFFLYFFFYYYFGRLNIYLSHMYVVRSATAHQATKKSRLKRKGLPQLCKTDLETLCFSVCYGSFACSMYTNIIIAEIVSVAFLLKVPSKYLFLIFHIYPKQLRKVNNTWYKRLIYCLLCIW